MDWIDEALAAAATEWSRPVPKDTQQAQYLRGLTATVAARKQIETYMELVAELVYLSNEGSGYFLEILERMAKDVRVYNNLEFMMIDKLIELMGGRNAELAIFLIYHGGRNAARS